MQLMRFFDDAPRKEEQGMNQISKRDIRVTPSSKICLVPSAIATSSAWRTSSPSFDRGLYFEKHARGTVWEITTASLRGGPARLRDGILRLKRLLCLPCRRGDAPAHLIPSATPVISQDINPDTVVVGIAHFLHNGVC